MTKTKRLLVVAAHPDDEVLGCGATVRLRVNQGWTARLAIMTAGVTGRLAGDAVNEAAAEQAELADQMRRAAEVIGFETTTVFGFPDNRMDTVSRMDLAQALMPLVQDYRPDLVITHHPGDYNWDHTLTFDAVMMAARPNPPDHAPSEIWTFEVPSSTERAWQDGARAFHPNLYVNAAATIDQKKLALMYYRSEYRAYPHPRSVEALEYLARRRGSEVGLAYAEAFHVVRRVEG
ncbi:MAG: PIG-L deacetylase family protein [Solirubrobacterales bacterium]